MTDASTTFAEISNGELQRLVETCKKKRLERTITEMSQDQTGRFVHQAFTRLIAFGSIILNMRFSLLYFIINFI